MLSYGNIFVKSFSQKYNKKCQKGKNYGKKCK